MAQNITLLGASYSDVPSVLLPKTGGGTAQFDDTTIASNAASASDITSGKLAFVNGLLITGTGGGGGGGLEYETGTWTPAEDVNNYVISFNGTHTVAPWYYLIVDETGVYSDVTNSNYSILYYNYHQLTGAPFNVSTTTNRYAAVQYFYRSSATAVTNGILNITYPYTYKIGVSSNCSRFWATETGIKAYTNGDSRYWRTGRTYKWIAVWAPTS